LLVLTSLADNAVAAAASVGGWEAAREGSARLLGHGDVTKTQVASGGWRRRREARPGDSVSGIVAG